MNSKTKRRMDRVERVALRIAEIARREVRSLKTLQYPKSEHFAAMIGFEGIANDAGRVAKNATTPE